MNTNVTSSANGEILLQRPAEIAPLGPGMQVFRALPLAELESVGPFVFLDHLGPIPAPKHGVPPHPHAGIEVISYLIEGAMEHRDSLGNHARVTSGGAQWLTSGRGILHAEYPGADVTPTYHGVQMWTRLPRSADDNPPQYHNVTADQIPEATGSGWKVRLPAGELPGILPTPGPIHLAQPALLAHVHLEPGASLDLPVNPAQEFGVYMLAGNAHLGAAQAAVPQHSLTLLRSTDTVRLKNNGTEPCELLLFGGEPAEKPLIFHGSFVFSTTEDASRAVRDYRAGRMGILTG